MELRHARTFVAVADLGTVVRAADHLRTAQPALSRHIGDLELELGLKLFDRVGRRLVLTSAGAQLLAECRALLASAEAVAVRAEVLKQGNQGTLRLAASPQHIESVLAHFLHRYGSRYPNVKVSVTEAPGIAIVEMLERGDVHLAQNLEHAVDTSDTRFGTLSLGHIDMLAASHPNVHLGKGMRIDITELASLPLLLMHTQFTVRRSFDAACRLAGLTPNILMESRTPHALLALAEAGHGVAIIPSQLQTHRYDLRLVGVTYKGAPLREAMVIQWDNRRPQPPYATTFCSMLADYVREVFPISRPTALTKPSRSNRRSCRTK